MGRGIHALACWRTWRRERWLQLPLKCHMALFRAPAGSLPTLAAATLAALEMLTSDKIPSSMLLM